MAQQSTQQENIQKCAFDIGNQSEAFSSGHVTVNKAYMYRILPGD